MATDVYLPADPWMGMITMLAVILMAVGLRGFLGRIAIFLGLVFGYLLSWIFDLINVGGVAGDRVNWDTVKNADWFGFPEKTVSGLVGNQNELGNMADVGWHLPSFSITFALLAMPGVIALVAENIGHVKAVSGMTGNDLDPYIGRAVAADGVGTVDRQRQSAARPPRRTPRTSGSWPPPASTPRPPTTWPRSSRSCSGSCPKFGAVIYATPGGVIAGITIVLYGMIGLLGAKIWIENHVNFGEPSQPGRPSRPVSSPASDATPTASSRSPTTSSSAASPLARSSSSSVSTSLSWWHRPTPTGR